MTLISLSQWGHFWVPLSHSYQIPFAGRMKKMFSFVNHSFMVTGLLLYTEGEILSRKKDVAVIFVFEATRFPK